MDHTSFDSNAENASLTVRRGLTLIYIAHEVLHCLASLAENRACGIAKFPDSVFIGTRRG